jgi:DNA adenine methylase
MNHYPVLAWPGGKRRLAKVLLPLIHSRPHTCYAEHFAGGASMFFLRQPAGTEVINDINSDVVNLYRVIKNHLDEFIRQFRYTVASRELFEQNRETPPHVLTDVQRAARFLYIQKLAFGGKVSSTTFGTSPSSPPRFNVLRLEDDLSQAHFRLARTWIEHLPWHECLTKWDRDYTLHFLDPPYWETEGYGVPFDLDEYHRIAEAMTTMKGSAILTINDHPTMREIFQRFRLQTVDITYTIGGVESRAKRKELIYCNW